MANQVKTKKSKFKKVFNTYGTALLFALPYLIIFAVFFIYPFFYGIFISFFKWNIFDPNKTEFIGFGNYATILFGETSISLPGANS